MRCDEIGSCTQGKRRDASPHELDSRPVLGKGRSNSSNLLNANGVEPFPAVTEVTEEDVSARNTRASEELLPATTNSPSYDGTNDGTANDTEKVEPTKEKKGIFGKKKKPVIQRNVSTMT